MALVTYIEPINLGGAFMGLGMLTIACVAAWLLYRLYDKLTKYFDVVINREAKYGILEEVMLDNIAQKKGIDLNKELVRKNMFDNKKRKFSFRRKVEEQIYEAAFGKEVNVKKE